jgi:hypothetical protein
MAAQVAVNLFDVERGQRTRSLADTIEVFDGLPLDRRWRDDIRLDRISEETVDGARGYFLDFAKKRAIGPGKLTDGRAIEGIQMRGDEDFGEETAALFVPSKQWLLVLNNQAGVGPNRMMGYFNAVDPGVAHLDYEANPKIDPTALAQLRRMRRVTSVQVSASVDALNASEREVGTAMARAVRPAGAQRVSFSLMANEPHKKGRFLEGQMIKDLVRNLRGADGGGVTSLKITGEDPDADKDMMIDLIRHRIKRKFRVDELEVVDKRYTIESRWQLLTRAFRSWHNTL